MNIFFIMNMHDMLTIASRDVTSSHFAPLCCRKIAEQIRVNYLRWRAISAVLILACLHRSIVLVGEFATVRSAARDGKLSRKSRKIVGLYTRDPITADSRA